MARKLRFFTEQARAFQGVCLAALATRMGLLCSQASQLLSELTYYKRCRYTLSIYVLLQVEKMGLLTGSRLGSERTVDLDALEVLGLAPCH